MNHPGLLQVIDVLAVPGDHPLVLDAQDPLAHPPRRERATSEPAWHLVKERSGTSFRAH